MVTRDNESHLADPWAVMLPKRRGGSSLLVEISWRYARSIPDCKSPRSLIPPAVNNCNGGPPLRQAAQNVSMEHLETLIILRRTPCWTLFSLLLPTALAYIIHLENNCGSGSLSVIREDGTRVDGVNSYESSGIVSVFLDQGTCGPLGQSCSTVRVNESGRAVGSSSTFSVPITLLYSVADHLTITFCPAVPMFVDQHVPPRFRRLVSRQVSEMLWTPIVIASISELIRR
ncbi:uncharacterized protein ARMOST_18874 [Armillaria ostoyae]|uniref:Uncharacterized protein n=1 Tax=Armillaria ostoyae TaxID=47428 RepID=A0A284S311_ARMOS|nr:uncharacterized protein ARMOST_18874 [Armillaria ostoyae]